MKLKDFLLLKKLMQLTTSESDAEALQALRRANAILSQNSVGWERVFDRLVTVVADVEPAPVDDLSTEAERRAENSEILAAFEIVEATNPKGDFGDFIQSLREQWDAKKSLSPKQRDALRKAAQRVNEDRDNFRGGRFR